MSPQEPDRVRRFARVAAALLAVRALPRRGSAHPSAPEDEDPPVRPVEDPSERTVPANRRAETLVAGLLVLAAVFGFGFTVVYVVASLNTQLLGLAIGGMLGLLAVVAIVVGKMVVPQETAVEERDVLLQEEKVEEIVEMVEAGGEGVSRRVLLVGAGGLAGLAVVTAAATPLASLGPRLTSIHATPVAARSPLRRRGEPALPGQRDRDRKLLHRAAGGSRLGADGGSSLGREVARPTTSVCRPNGGAGPRRESSPTRRSARTRRARSRCIAIPRSARPPGCSPRSRVPATTRRSCPARAGGSSSVRPAGPCPSCR